ncbi:MAG: GGDEF domain-containing phosphodiesterase [Blastomonas sp.]
METLTDNRGTALEQGPGLSCLVLSRAGDMAAALAVAGFDADDESGKPHDLLVIDLRADAANILHAHDGSRHSARATLVIADPGDAVMQGWAGKGAMTHFLAVPITPAALQWQLAAIRQFLRPSGDGLSRFAAWLADAVDAVPYPVHCMLIGMTRLDALNKIQGQASGDRILQAVEERLAHFCTAQGLGGAAVFRLGAEFLIGWRGDGGREQWQDMAEKAREAVSRPYDLAGRTLRLGGRTALGIARTGESAADIVERLQSALNRARLHESSPVQWADRSADGAPANAAQLEQDLPQALEQGQLAVVYQPQFLVSDGRLIGAEALARWNHPTLGEIGAGTLFAIAEKVDLTCAVSVAVRRLALEEAAAWPKALSDIRLSLNVTAQDLTDRSFVSHELGRIGQSGFDPRRLTLEITESALIPNMRRAASLFGKIRDAGPRIAVDDFGTGYSNLLYLNRLPLDYLKLDQAMTRDMDGEQRDRIIARSIIALGKALGLKVIAEGVETEGQLAALKDEGCDHFQGFLRGAAMPGEAFVTFAMRAN